MTVAELIEHLQIGLREGTYRADDVVKICDVWPYHRTIETVCVPAPHITERCVAIYSS